MYASRTARSRALGIFIVLSLASACGGGGADRAQPGGASGYLFLHGPELVQNGSFTTGLQNWGTWFQDGGSAVVAAVDGRAVVRVKSPATTDWGIQLSSQGMPLAAGKTYRFTFRARADVPASIDALVQENGVDLNGDGSAWSSHQYGTYALSTVWTQYTADFTMRLDDPNARINFYLGQATSKVFIDDVSLVEVITPPPGTELVDNGDFSSKLVGWEKTLMDGGDATFGIGKGAALVTVTTPATTVWGVQLHHGAVPLFAGRLYRLSFTAWAAAPVRIRALVQENGHDVNADGFAYSEYQNAFYSLGTTPQRYSAWFYVPVTNVDAGVYFNYGDASGKVWVDDVSVMEVPPPPPGTELIANGKFDADLSGWTTYLMNGGQAGYSVVDGEGVVDIASPASDYSGVQLSYNGVPLQAGRAYRLTFHARAEQPGSLGTSIWENGNDTNGDGFAWSTYRFDWHEVGPAMAAYEVEFIMPTTNLGAGLCFFLGELRGRVTIDDVSVVEIDGLTPPPPPPPPGTELLANGTFDAGLAGWDPWVGGGTTGTVEAVGGEVVMTTTASTGSLGGVQIGTRASLRLYAGKTYRLRFDARSDAWAPIYAVVYEGSTGASYVWNYTPLTPVMSTYSVDFTVPATSADVSVALLAGDAVGQVVIDNVSLAEPPPPPPPVELVANGTFDAGLAGWTTYLNNGGDATYTVLDGEAVVSVTSATDFGGVQLSYSGLPLEAGRAYRFSFRARADWYRYLQTSVWENGHDLDGDGSAWGTYRFDYNYLTPYMSWYSLDFVMPVTNPDAGLVFFLGETTGQVVIDDVSLIALQ